MRYLSTLIGLGLLGLGGYLLFQEPPSAEHADHVRGLYALIGTGLLLTVPGQLADGLKKVATAALDAYKKYKEKKADG
jgi:hypothetical protein